MTTADPNAPVWMRDLNDAELESFIIHARNSLAYAHADVKNHTVRLDQLEDERRRRRLASGEAEAEVAQLVVNEDGTITLGGRTL